MRFKLYQNKIVSSSVTQKELSAFYIVLPAELKFSDILYLIQQKGFFCLLYFKRSSPLGLIHF